jgi:[ribosomal protein S5]-alanine N-acetyltransferase
MQNPQKRLRVCYLSRQELTGVVMIVLETERLILRRLSIDDAEFILELLNEPSFLRYIGDKGVRSVEDARRYILNGPVDSYQRNGYGLYLVQLKLGGLAIGISGLVKRAALADPDIGFAFLQEQWSKGYAFESASALMIYAREVLKLKRILAITAPDNESSINLLRKIGLRFERMIRLSDDAPLVKLFTSDT